MRRLTKLQRIYIRYNELYFNNELPNPPEIKVRFGEMKEDVLGYQLGDEIVLNKRDRRWGKLWRWTLLHEMVHLSLPEKVRHGEPFQERMKALAVAGAFKDIW